MELERYEGERSETWDSGMTLKHVKPDVKSVKRSDRVQTVCSGIKTEQKKAAQVSA